MPTIRLLEAVQTYIKTYTGLASGAPVWVEYLGVDPAQYAIIPLAGSRIVETYLNGGTLREFPFAFQAVLSSADDAARLAGNGFFEAFSDWLDAQTTAGVLPTLNASQTPEKIEALGWGAALQEGESGTAIYQVQCKLTYEQAA